jgi:hypothetical protein
MESTGVYWIPLFQILEAREFEVPGQCAVFPECSGRRTDVSDCQWLRICTVPSDSCGLLFDRLIRFACSAPWRAIVTA